MTVADLPDIETVIGILREVAATEIVPRFGRLAHGDVSHKRHPNDLVTVADIAAERRLIELLVALAPGSRVVGEEGTEADPGLLAALAGPAPVWLVDPVDGTANFAAGTACFAVVVAWCIEGRPLAGWILDPMADVTVAAAAGAGAWRYDAAGRHPVRASRRTRIGEMTGSVGRRSADRLGAACVRTGGAPPTIVRYGSAGREYMDLALGILDFAQYGRLKPWDHAAGVLIHAEAGGWGALRANGGTPYRAEPQVVDSPLLLAPDESVWRFIDGVLG